MKVDTKQLITITEANHNFASVASIADKKGSAFILENNKLKYKLINLEVEPDLELTDDEKIDVIARRVMQRFKPAFIALAK